MKPEQLLIDLQSHIKHLEDTVEKQKKEIEKLQNLITLIQDASPERKKFDL